MCSIARMKNRIPSARRNCHAFLGLMGDASRCVWWASTKLDISTTNCTGICRKILLCITIPEVRGN